MASNLNVWVIENDIDDFSSLIDKIKGDAKNTLYTNCVCRFKIADNIIPINPSIVITTFVYLITNKYNAKSVLNIMSAGIKNSTEISFCTVLLADKGTAESAIDEALRHSHKDTKLFVCYFRSVYHVVILRIISCCRIW